MNRILITVKFCSNYFVFDAVHRKVVKHHFIVNRILMIVKVEIHLPNVVDFAVLLAYSFNDKKRLAFGKV